jgi:hypothetical protein
MLLAMTRCDELLCVFQYFAENATEWVVASFSTLSEAQAYIQAHQSCG